MNRQIVLVVMDGIGIGRDDEGNAVKLANTKTLDHLMETCPNLSLKAHGTAVGLPSDDDMGNSEVGHNALGCGQVYSQGAKLVNESLESGKLFASPVWQNFAGTCKTKGSTMHFIGLLSDGNVHSNIEHLKQMITRAKDDGLTRVRVHILLDGRDVPATSALDYVEDLETLLNQLSGPDFDAKIASGGGRMKITMDRYQANWSMVALGWQTHVYGQGRQFPSAAEAIRTYRDEEPGIIDQDLPPFVVGDRGDPVGAMRDDDCVILFNFRGDRAIELSMAFDWDTFTHFDRGDRPRVHYAGMLQYDGDLQIPRQYLVSPPDIQNTLSELLVLNKVHQYAVSETQKYGHVTYFWNGNRSEKFSDDYEDFEEIPSDKVSFDERPWMKAADVTDRLMDAIRSNRYGFLRCNYPNGDMVGHTGNLQATRIGVEAVDLCLARVKKLVDEKNCILLITADHGNADDMLEKSKSGKMAPKTAHSLNPVPFILYDPQGKFQLREPGDYGLANVAATVASLMNIPAPPMWEESLLAK